MSEQASNAGWVVRVTTKRLGGGAPAVELFNAHIADEQQAVAAVRKLAGASTDTIVEAVEQLSASVLAGLGLEDGKVESSL